jgi:ribosomal protein L11 methyltransferase
VSDDYLLITVSVAREHAQAVEDALLQFGALSCTFADAEDQPIHEPAPGTQPLWSLVEITGMFAADAEPELLCRLVHNAVPVIDLNQLRSKMLKGRQWERAWMDDYAPIEVSDKLWVVPSFCNPPDPKAVNISIDPGLAFGSGTHATTYLCLQWLSRQPLEGRSVIDYGCGSGILAIAATMLGASRVYAFDIDPQALHATEENAVRNGVGDRIDICRSDRDLPGGVDFIVANILLSPLLELTNRFSTLLTDDGKLGLSGVLAEQVGLLAGAYATRFQHEETEIRDQWALYSAKRFGVLQP